MPGFRNGLMLLALWWGIRIAEFAFGFVAFSMLRLWLALVIPIGVHGVITALGSPSSGFVFTRLYVSKRIVSVIVMCAFIGLTLSGFALHWSRIQRGANLGDVDLFRQSVLSTARLEGWLVNEYEGGSHFRAHFSPFLLGLVPFIWFFGEDLGWHVIQLIHSGAIVLWVFSMARIHTRLFGLHQPAFYFLIVLSLFLSTYSQHAGFYDTRFAALGLALFVLGCFARNSWQLGAGFLLTLSARETTVLLLIMLLLLLPSHLFNRRRQAWLLGISLVWFLGSLLVILWMGGPVSAGRFEQCLTSPAVSAAYVDCLIRAVETDWQLKLGYTIRILFFGLPAFITGGAILLGTLPDLITTWLSKDNVLYNMSWHYYMPTLTVSLILGALSLRQRFLDDEMHIWVSIWLIATGLWQFVTTFHPRLF